MNRRSRICLLLLALAVAGCGRALPTSPEGAAAAPSEVVARPATEPSTAAPSAEPATLGSTLGGLVGEVGELVRGLLGFVIDPSRDPLPGPLVYVPSIVKLVLPGLETNVTAGRWSLDFHPGSLRSPKPISIAEASDGTMRVSFGPDGTRFGRDVDLTIDYSGTSLDPSSPAYRRGTRPAFLYFDPARDRWVEVPSTNDVAHRTLRAKLQHFSTYGVGTRAGW